MNTRTQTAASSEAALRQAVQTVEDRLAHLSQALEDRQPAAIEAAAHALQESLVIAVRSFGGAARQGRIPPELRRRLALVSGAVAAQRESLSRTMAALDRAIDVLLPSPPPVVYSDSHRGSSAGWVA